MIRPCARTQSKNWRSPGWWPVTFPVLPAWRRRRFGRPSKQPIRA